MQAVGNPLIKGYMAFKDHYIWFLMVKLGAHLAAAVTSMSEIDYSVYGFTWQNKTDQNTYFCATLKWTPEVSVCSNIDTFVRWVCPYLDWRQKWSQLFWTVTLEGGLASCCTKSHRSKKRELKESKKTSSLLDKLLVGLSVSSNADVAQTILMLELVWDAQPSHLCDCLALPLQVKRLP